MFPQLSNVSFLESNRLFRITDNMMSQEFQGICSCSKPVKKKRANMSSEGLTKRVEPPEAPQAKIFEEELSNMSVTVVVVSVVVAV